ncbi:MAG: PAS-domain containing protein [Phenylobacterium sp.]
MTGESLILSAATGAVLLALGSSLLTWAVRRRAERRLSGLESENQALRRLAEGVEASAEAFGSTLIAFEEGSPVLISGEQSLADCARALGTAPEPGQVVAALMRTDPDHALRLRALIEHGESCGFEVGADSGVVTVEGRAAGALAWLQLTAASDAAELPASSRFAAFLNALKHPAWIATADGRPIWANSAWLSAVGAGQGEAAIRRLSLDPAADALAVEAAAHGQPRETVRWLSLAGRRRALRITARPLEGGGVGVWTEDVTEAEELREALRRNVEAHDETLNHIADAVAIFTASRRLHFHNTAFADLFGLEPAWLAERPSHGEVLDRLRQRRKLPETTDYARWKASELERYARLDSAPDELWSLPDGRTLRVVRQPHPLGGVVLLFSDITGELRLKAQYNSQIQVQQATLDKLSDAVAVFGADGRLRLHNEAFERFWKIPGPTLNALQDFEGVVELCLPRLHDMSFWRELKGRVADTDPAIRTATSGEVRTSDGRIVAHQSRPLPDGATLIAFTDVTDARRLERALADRSAALAEAERLKRDFVGNVSYELRTPLTTIIGYSELMEGLGEALPQRALGHAAAIRQAAEQLGRSIDDVLDMAQIDAGEMALDLEDVSLPHLLEAAASRWSDEAEAGQVRLMSACPEDLGLFRGDSRRLAQVLDHLILNALGQTSKGGRITLNARRTLGEVQIQVIDTGRGIPFHVQAYIFDRFIGRERGGPGLGLALVKALVELHGGWVALESEPGAGATFTCHLPEGAEGAVGHPELEF